MTTSWVSVAESIVDPTRGCWWWDSNPQGLAPRDVWGLCVYRFRHTSTSPAANPGKLEGRDVKPHTCRRPWNHNTRRGAGSNIEKAPLGPYLRGAVIPYRPGSFSNWPAKP